MKTTVRLTPPILHELQAQLLRAGSLSAEMTLVEERHSNGDIVVRLAGLPSAEVQEGQIELRAFGVDEVEAVLGCYRGGGLT